VERIWTELAQASLPGGDLLTLRQCGSAFEIRFNLFELMSSRNPASERALADVACARLDGRAAHVLIGGLGLGYTVRAMLDSLGPEARVTVAELVPEVIDWNRGPLADAAGHPLEDPRVTVFAGDVAVLVRASAGRFDAILLDVDNGPDAVLFEGNRALYAPAGIAELIAALRPGGLLAFWSADRSPAFEEVLAGCSMDFDRMEIAVEDVDHSLYLMPPGPRPRSSRR